LAAFDGPAPDTASVRERPTRRSGRYWVYPTYSAPYDQQTFLDAFSSRDLVTWTKHPRVLDTTNVSWARRAVWAPSVIRKDGWY
jgi:beta-xylosidase